MIIDALIQLEDHYEADLCIIGAGAAGITLAKEWVGQSARVILLESGGYAAEVDAQSLYEGDVAGNPYFPLVSCRLRQFGGSTGHWGGACWPLESIDFERRDWIPHSGWPIGLSELTPYYKRAQVVCNVGPFSYQAADWSDEEKGPLLPLEEAGVVTKFYQNSSPPRHFGIAFRKKIEKAQNITALLHANVSHMQLERGGERLSEVKIKSFGGKKSTVRAKVFVLATGGLENPRLLLQSNDVQVKGIGNQEDMVGRFFMEHVHVPAARMILNKDINMRMYTRHGVRGTDIRGGFGLSAELLRSERILSSWMGLGLRGAPPWPHVEGRKESPKDPSIPRIGLNNMVVYGHEFVTRGKPATGDMNFRIIDVASHSEQAPNPLSRVMLSNEVDKLGMKKIRLDWRLTDLDRKSVYRAQEILGTALGAKNIGRLRITLDGDKRSWSDPQRVSKIAWPFGSYHHMGTTRMHASPKQGVVDANCCVHGVKNLYIAGSSVFPTCGYVNPTLTIVALACRLADKLKKVLVAA